MYWRIQLDQDLLETIINIYPEWFKDIYLSFTVMTDNDEQNLDQLGKMIIPLLQSRDTVSPPKAIVDEASLQQAMDKNKESLKVKLMTRRPINQLVEQGIMPSLKVPPHFHEQRQKLERAKMGDFLKNKIQKRPDRQELIQQHILEDTTVDPSLQDKQRQLKKARLTDELNDRLSHRPGPLELVKGNILHADEKFAQAVKEGQIQFKRTCEGQSLRHPPPSFVLEEDSGSDIALSPPQDILDQSLGSVSSVDAIVPSPYQNQGSPSSQGDLRLTQTTPTNCVPSPTSSQSSSFSHGESYHKENVPTVRNKKKPKPKSLPKARTIKFHEYKGPPNALKNQTSPSSSPSETSYELLLYQQQVFLQWQLELQHKYPQMILPVSQHPNGDQSQNLNNGQNGPIEQSQDSPVSSPQKSISKLEDMKVSDLKAELKKRNLPVSGSKPQLIERLKPYSEMALSGLNNNNLASSVIDTVTTSVTTDTNAVPMSVGGIILDSLPTLTPKTEPPSSIMTMDTSTSPPSQVKEEPALVVYNAVPVQGQLVATSRPASTAPMDVESNSISSDAMDCSDAATVINENIVKLQQKRIEELQRELQRSQMQLQQQQWLQQQQAQQALLAAQPVPIAPALVTQQQQQLPTATAVTPTLQQANALDTKALQRLQQHLQQKFQQQQLLQHLQQQQAGNANAIKFSPGSPAMSAAVKANLAAFIHNQHINSNARLPNPSATVSQQSIPPFPGIQPIVLCQTGVFPNGGEKPRANSLPNGLGQQRTSSLPNFSTVITAKPVSENENNNTQYLSTKSPPNYHEATKQCAKNKQNNQEQKPQSSSGTTKQRSNRKSVKSQAVEDVLEILIKNGELPPSAAQEPPTPTTPETQKPSLAPPEFPTSSAVKTSSSPSLPVTSCLTIPSTAGLPTNSLPSSVLQDSDGVANPTLDFDFHLELQEIEAMDLGMLDHDPNEVSNSSAMLSNQSGSNSAAQQCHDADPGLSGNSVDMDIELSDWLDVLAAAPSDGNHANSTSAQPVYNCGGDPLLSNMANGQHDTFDLFSLEDMDFKTPTDLNILSWDKVDYAT